jgi:Protein of unknown function (DUF3800)
MPYVSGAECEVVARLLDVLLPDGGMAMQLVEAYFDESGSDATSEVLCLAGYVFQKDACVELDLRWRDVLAKYKLPFFRMSACAHGVKPFDALSMDQRIAVEKEMIGLIKDYAAFGMAVTVDPKQFDAIMPKIPEVGSAYSFCAHSCLVAVRWWADQNNYFGDIAYFFESGHRSASEANEIMNRIFNMRNLRESHRYASHTFADKRKVRPLQAADLLAWQWFTDQKRRMYGAKRPVRKDCYALVENSKPPHRVLHVNQQMLEWHQHRILSGLYPATFPGTVPAAPPSAIETVNMLNFFHDANTQGKTPQ